MKRKFELKNIINKNDIYVFIGMFIFSLVVCANFLRVHFAADTYCVYSMGYSNYIIVFLQSSRFFSALEMWISKILDISFLTNLKIMSVIGIILITASWFILYKFVLKLLNKEKSIYWNILIALITFSVVFNFSSCEMFMFAESGIFCLSILFAIIGACVFNSNIKHRYLLSLLFVILSSVSYQANISLFVIIALVIEAYKNKGNIKKIIEEALLIGLFYGGTLALNLVLVKLIENILGSGVRSTAIPEIKIIIETIKKYGTIMAVNTFEVFPKYFYIIITGIISILYIFNCCKSKDYFSILEYIILIILAVIIPLLPVIATAQEKQYLEPRMALSYSALLGILLLYIVLKFDIDNIIVNKKIAMFMAIIVMLINSLYFVRTSTENVASGYLDRNVAKSMLEEIYEYQIENDIKIQNIGIAYDRSSSTYYNGQPSLESANVRSMVIDWSAIQVLEFYSGEKYNMVVTPDDVKQEFLKYNWGFYNPKQLIFRGDTVYICLY